MSSASIPMQRLMRVQGHMLAAPGAGTALVSADCAKKQGKPPVVPKGNALLGACDFSAFRVHPPTASWVSVGTDSVIVTATAPVNIAVIKYWGKRDEELILPVNSSLSGTIDQGAMCSTTTITASKSFAEDTMTLNGK